MTDVVHVSVHGPPHVLHVIHGRIGDIPRPTHTFNDVNNKQTLRFHHMPKNPLETTTVKTTASILQYYTI